MRSICIKIAAIAALMLLIVVLPKQAEANDNRHVLVEIFTSTTCPPCFPANVGFSNWLSNYENAERVSVIKYPVSWPGSGCIYHWQNPNPVNARRTYYGGINSAPSGVVDGAPVGGSWTAWRTAILNQIAVESPLDIDLIAVLNGNTIDVTVDLTRLAGSDWPAQGLSLRLAVVERNIQYNAPNGSTNQDFVHREMINGAAGVPIDLVAGQTETLSYSQDVVSGWNNENLKVVAFVQPTAGNQGRAVVQSAMFPVLSELAVGVPSTQEPADGAELVPLNDITFEWTSALLASAFDVQVSESEDFQNTSAELLGQSGTSAVIAELDPETEYFWRVRGTNSNLDLTGEWSAVSSFTTIMAAPGTQPSLLQPANGSEVTSQFITLRWTELESADSYDVELSGDSNFNDVIISRSDITQLNTTVSDLEMGETYYWRVRGVNIGGAGVWSEAFTFSTPTGTSTEPITELPGELKLNQNYPNPFNPATTISFVLPEASEISLSLYSLDGRLVATIAEGQYSAGTHTMSFDASALASGTYIYRLDAAGQTLSRLMTLLK
ncbi:MAG: Omp28-related outer membrane protein [Balneolia bacterium]|nr:Omp28-related outer membrane protein [Balneolia bacterium]